MKSYDLEIERGKELINEKKYSKLPKHNTSMTWPIERSVGVRRLVRKAGEVYYFSHEVVKKYEAGEIEFVDESGRALKPSYFGAGGSGMNGTLKAS